MPAVQIRLNTTEYTEPTFGWYEIFADTTDLGSADVEAYADFQAIFFANTFIHANLHAGETWHYWVRAVNDNGATVGDLIYLGAITLSASSDGDSADLVSYDNSSSHLAATNVQDALDEIEATVASLSSSGGGGTGSGPSTFEPQGRLTLTAGVPVLTLDVTGATTVYYTPFRGEYIPLYDGANWAPHSFSEFSQALSNTTKQPAAIGAYAVADAFVWNDNGTSRLCFVSWSRAQTFTVTINSPAVFTCTGHGFYEGMPFIPSTNGALPTGITAGTPIFPIGTSFAANTFQASATAGGAAINTSGSQSGTHAATEKVTSAARGTGAGTSELQLLNGILTNKYDITNGPLANRGTYVGLVVTDGSSQVNMKFGGAGASGGEAPTQGVWNYYNRRRMTFYSNDNKDTWTYGSTSWQIKDASFSNRFLYAIGVSEDSIQAENTEIGFNGSANDAIVAGIGINSTKTRSGSNSATSYAITSQASIWHTVTATYDGRPPIGQGYVAPLEHTGGIGTMTWGGDNGQNGSFTTGDYIVSMFKVSIWC